MNAAFRTLHRAFHEPDTRLYRVTSGVVYALIVASVVLFVVELGDIREQGQVRPALVVLDRTVLAFFAAELIARLASYVPPAVRFYRLDTAARARAEFFGRLRYLFTPLMLVDLLTVLAFFPAARGLRAVRLLRLIRTRRLFRYGNPFGGLAQAFRDNRVLYAFAVSVLGVEVLVGGLTMYLVETNRNPAMKSPADGMWWAIVTLTTVGFGDITPETTAGRFVAAILMVGGMFTLALFAGIVGSTLLTAVLRMQEDQFRMSGHVDHIVVCGYEEGMGMLLQALLAEVDPRETPLVLFGAGDRPRDLLPDFVWIRGDPAKESELEKARIAVARAVVLAGSRQLPPQQADAATILVAFTIRRYLRGLAIEARRARPLYIVAEILEDENVEHARTAGCDEVIETRRLGFSLVAHAVKEPGAANVMSRVAVAGDQNLYLGAIPSRVVLPSTFGEVAKVVHDDHGALLIGMRDLDTNESNINPGDDFVVRAGMQVIYLADAAVVPDPR